MSIIIELLINIVNRIFYFKKINNYLKQLNINIVIDVGAHKGEFYKSLTDDLTSIKKSVLVEPQNHLIKNLYLLKNKLSHMEIDIEDYALGEKKEIKPIQINSLSSTSSFLKIDQKSKWYKFKKLVLLKKHKNLIKKNNILIDTLDNLIDRKKLEQIDLLKIDTEGFEYEVLKGAKESLKLKKIKNILIEKQLSKMYLNYDFEKVEKILKKNGFLLLKKFRFPLALFEDRIYTIKQNKN